MEDDQKGYMRYRISLNVHQISIVGKLLPRFDKLLSTKIANKRVTIYTY